MKNSMGQSEQSIAQVDVELKTSGKKKKFRKIDVELMRKHFSYNPENGRITHKFRVIDRALDARFNKKFAGTLADTFIRPTGYRVVGLFHDYTSAHRIAWAIYYGECAGGFEIDHINRDKSDNRICNLRLATRSQNSMNVAAQKNNSSKLKGAHWNSRTGKYRSKIMLNGKEHFLGYFTTAEEASAAYAEASKKLHGEFGRVK